MARDVVERHGVSKPKTASLLSQRLLGLNARQLSLRKMTNDLKAAGIATSREALGELFEYFQEAYLVFSVKELSFSLSEKTTAQPKVYAVDPGLALACGTARANYIGQRLEDVVYLELRRRSVGMRRDGISSLRTKAHGYEVDFVVGDALSGEVYELYQVAADVSDEKTREREIRALWEALEQSEQTVGYLIAGNGAEEMVEHEGKTIVQLPAWKWLLGAV